MFVYVLRNEEPSTAELLSTTRFDTFLRSAIAKRQLQSFREKI